MTFDKWKGIWRNEQGMSIRHRLVQSALMGHRICWCKQETEILDDTFGATDGSNQCARAAHSNLHCISSNNSIEYYATCRWRSRQAVVWLVFFKQKISSLPHACVWRPIVRPKQMLSSLQGLYPYTNTGATRGVIAKPLLHRAQHCWHVGSRHAVISQTRKMPRAACWSQYCCKQ